MKVGEPYNPYNLFVGVFIPNAICRYKHLSQGAKICFGRLKQYAGENGEAWPSMQTLSEELGISRRQAVNYLKELKENGFIDTIRTPTTDKFIFLWHSILEESLRSYPQKKKGREINFPTDGKYSSQQMGNKLPNPREINFPQRESLRETYKEVLEPSCTPEETKKYFDLVKKTFKENKR
jgi:DNA-binding transcriptional MocR family regulator